MNDNPTPNLIDPRPCIQCKGTGRRTSPALRGCTRCKGRGHFDPPHLQAIATTLRGRGGKGLRVRRPRHNLGSRYYYVWRMARFHGGADVCMPVMAELVIDGDPFVDELQALAEVLAHEAFGTNMAAAERWAPLLGLRS